MKTIKTYKAYFLLCIVIISLSGCGESVKHPVTFHSSENVINKSVYYKVEFSPSPKTTKLITEIINDANKSIYVAAYCLTSAPITDSLINAHVRGVDVKVILDNLQVARNSSNYNKLLTNGVAVRKSKKYKLMHNKFMVIDKNIVETGSFNYTSNAERYNAENIIVIYHDVALAKKYLDAWQILWDASK